MADNRRVGRHHYDLDDADEQALDTIKARYGPKTDVDAVRLALRVLAASEHLKIPNWPDDFYPPAPRPGGRPRRARAANNP